MIPRHAPRHAIWVALTRGCIPRAPEDYISLRHWVRRNNLLRVPSSCASSTFAPQPANSIELDGGDIQTLQEIGKWDHWPASTDVADTPNEPERSSNLRRQQQHTRRRQVEPTLSQALSVGNYGWTVFQDAAQGTKVGQDQIVEASHLHRVISNYIRRSRRVDAQLRKNFTKDELAYLHGEGYAAEEIDKWAWILCANTADKGIRRLLRLAKPRSDAQPSEAPLTIILYILRAENLQSSSIQLLLTYLHDRYERQLATIPQVTSSTAEYRNARHQAAIDEPSSMILIVRLLRHARKVLPEAMTSIADLACHILRGTVPLDASESGVVTSKSAQQLSLYFNRILSLLAVPTSQNPYLTIAIQQQAQFRILKRMTDFRPHIPVTREGFRAMIWTQVAHKKTDAEREWAGYKAITWPPWKQDKSGLDVGKHFEGSISRGGNVLLRMLEAGYDAQDWEKMAKIFSGWDLDGSPTIQTRRLLPRPPPSFEDTADPVGIVCARIQATRTIKEAWAAFLEYERSVLTDHATSDLHLDPYKTMLERLYTAEVKQGLEIQPGDVVEHFPEPTSPHDFMYVAEPPPTPNDFIQRMNKHGLSLGHRTVRMIIDSASDLSHVLDTWNSRPDLAAQLPLLIRVEQYSPGNYRRIAQGQQRQKALSSYVKFLCRSRMRPETFRDIRYSYAVPDKSRGDRSRDTALVSACGYSSFEINSLTPWQYAYCILKLGHIRDWSAWTSVLQKAAAEIGIKDPETGHKHLDLSRLARVEQIVSDMRNIQISLDFKSFEIISSALCDVLPDAITDLNQKCLTLIKPMFSRLISLSTTFDNLPRSTTRLSTPPPFTLLTLVRILGLTSDIPSMLTLLQWMSIHYKDLTFTASQTSSGPRKLRDVLVTLRIYMERLWDDERFLRGAPSSTSSSSSRTKDLISQAKEIVNGTTVMGGWPTDDECREFCWISDGVVNDWKERMRFRAWKRSDERS